MDDLTYTYKNSGKSNQLARVSDAVTTTGVPEVEQFEDGNTSGDDYLYDDSGNLKQDLNKGISTITYNHLNKPTLVTFANGKKIGYIYDAAGTKLRQKVFGNGGTSSTKETDYIGPFHYEDSDGDVSTEKPKLIFFSHEEGRVRRAGEELVYETFLKDHLGNVRVMFTDADSDGEIDPADSDEVLQVDHFYPFGLRMAGISTAPAVPNFYTFTGKEYQDELGLGWVDFGARMYDASVGRWNGVDALAEKYYSWSPFHYVLGNPIKLIDPNGEYASTHIDADGNVVAVYDDGDLGVYRHTELPDEFATYEGETKGVYIDPLRGSVIKKKAHLTGGEKVGETEYWDEFRGHDNESGKVENRVVGKLILGESWDQDIDHLNQDAVNGPVHDFLDIANSLPTVAMLSTPGKKYDIKSNIVVSPYGGFTGKLLQGKYATARSAGNYLAGLNGATGKIGYSHISEKTYMRIAGGLHKAGKLGAVGGVLGIKFGAAPYYGEITYAGRHIQRGFIDGQNRRK